MTTRGRRISVQEVLLRNHDLTMLTYKNGLDHMMDPMDENCSMMNLFDDSFPNSAAFEDVCT